MTLFILQRTTLVGVAVGLVFSVFPIFAGAQVSGGIGGSNGGIFPVSGGIGGSAPVSRGIGGSAPVAGGVGGGTVVQNPIQVSSICGLLKKIFEAAVPIAIPIAVLFIIWSGFKFVLAQGNPKELGKAKWNFFYTIIGIAVFLGAWLLAMVIAATINALAGYNAISCN